MQKTRSHHHTGQNILAFMKNRKKKRKKSKEKRYHHPLTSIWILRPDTYVDFIIILQRSRWYCQLLLTLISAILETQRQVDRKTDRRTEKQTGGQKKDRRTGGHHTDRRYDISMTINILLSQNDTARQDQRNSDRNYVYLV